ncbi:MAG: PQQ-dependent sugar dehydrogenase [Gammaproteobacteria bacterium]|nr:PQQ-dependent sugar dehydrogenase [Gammaproteobacteria bacterium]
MIKKLIYATFLLSLLVAIYLAYVFTNRGNLVWLLYSEGMPVMVEEIAAGLGIPWGMDFLDRDTLIYTERSGTIGVLDLPSGQYQTIKQLDNLFHKGECGLLDVKVSPDYDANRLVYFTYAKDISGGGNTSLAVARVENNKISDWTDLFIAKHDSTDDFRHCGSRITFDDQNHLFISTGDRGHRPNSQELSNHAGKIIRLNLDGTVPEDNPFVGVENAQNEIWSYGHRNPQGLFYDKTTERLWSNEHGPLGGDEVNLINAGQNYGWPVVSHGKDYGTGAKIGEGPEKAGMERPYKIWNPSIAPAGLLVYRGTDLTEWEGNLFSTALAQRHLNRLVLDSTGRVIFEERLLEELRDRFRAIIQNDAGEIYVSTDNGRILKLSFADEVKASRFNIFNHIDVPGFYLSFEINYLLSN